MPKKTVKKCAQIHICIPTFLQKGKGTKNEEDEEDPGSTDSDSWNDFETKFEKVVNQAVAQSKGLPDPYQKDPADEAKAVDSADNVPSEKAPVSETDIKPEVQTDAMPEPAGAEAS